MKKFLALFLMLVVSVLLVGCQGVTTTTAAGTATTADPTPETLVVGYDPFSEKFSPFFATTAYDFDVVNLVSVALMTTDLDGGIVYNAIEGETIARGENEYTYTGIANLGVDYNEATDQTTYSIEIRDDIQFSDGHLLDADDIIFDYYVLLDPYYSGSSTLGSVAIVGYEDYKFNSTASSEAKVEAEIQAPLLIAALGTETSNADLEALVREEIYGLLDSEWDWVAADVVTNEAYLNAGYLMKEDGTEATTLGEASIAATLAFFYALDEFSVVGLTRAQVVQGLADMYDLDYELVDTYYGASVVAPLVEADAYTVAMQIALETIEGDPVPNISGITKVDQTHVTILVDGFDAAAIYTICGITVAPMHYYGNAATYNYANNQFGFNNRAEDSMTGIQAKTATPLGAGPYSFVEYTDNVVYFEANPGFYKGCPKIEYINFQVVAEANKISAIGTGDIDISNPSGSKSKFAEIATYGDDLFTSSIDNLGYGYVGINAYNVNVNGVIDSDASIALRTAFATVIAAARHTSINSYYGQAAQIINYPMSNTSWAAPKSGELGYTIAFSKNPNGSNAYSADPATLADSVRLAAAKECARLWLIAAGYTLTVTAGTASFGGSLYTAVAPAGAKTTYEVIVPGDGTGDHPSFNLVTQFANVMAELGITIDINDPQDSNDLWDALDALTQEMWCAAWGSTIDPDLYQIYHSDNVVGGAVNSTNSNHYYIRDALLDQKIVEARQSDNQAVRKALYKECLDIIMSWAVEVPIYQRQNIIVFSAERINISTVTPEITTYWGWQNDVELMEMN